MSNYFTVSEKDRSKKQILKNLIDDIRQERTLRKDYIKFKIISKNSFI